MPPDSKDPSLTLRVKGFDGCHVTWQVRSTFQMHIAGLTGGDPVEFCGDLWRQKTRVPEYSVVCVILCLAVLVELRLVTDGQTNGRTWLVPQMHSVMR